MGEEKRHESPPITGFCDVEGVDEAEEEGRELKSKSYDACTLIWHGCGVEHTLLGGLAYRAMVGTAMALFFSFRFSALCNGSQYPHCGLGSRKIKKYYANWFSKIQKCSSETQSVYVQTPENPNRILSDSRRKYRFFLLKKTQEFANRAREFQNTHNVREPQTQNTHKESDQEIELTKGTEKFVYAGRGQKFSYSMYKNIEVYWTKSRRKPRD